MDKDKNDFAFARRWEKFILNDHRQLPKGIDRCRLIAYAFAMKTEGRNGLGCFKGDEAIGRELELCRDAVTKYRHMALALGWFVPSGERKGRAEVLNINIPNADSGQQSDSGRMLGTVEANADSGQQSNADSGQHYQVDPIGSTSNNHVEDSYVDCTDPACPYGPSRHQHLRPELMTSGWD